MYRQIAGIACFVEICRSRARGKVKVIVSDLLPLRRSIADRQEDAARLADALSESVFSESNSTDSPGTHESRMFQQLPCRRTT